MFKAWKRLKGVEKAVPSLLFNLSNTYDAIDANE